MRQYDRLGAAVRGCGEQFERAAASGGRDALARVAARVGGHGTLCLGDRDLQVEPGRDARQLGVQR